MKKRLGVLPLLLILSLALVTLLGFAVGKYMTTITKKNTATFTVRRAQNCELRESVIRQKDDGTYETTTQTIRSGTQNYTLLPGLDVPKDPHVVITGKTNIPAYLYVEVVDTTPNGALIYDLEDCWKSASKAPQHGGTMYIYCTAAANGQKTPAEITEDKTVYILKDNTVTAGQKLLHGDANNTLAFYAYLEEIPPVDTP